ncbi:MAG: NGG1p interacting factor NIF3 [Omnitrophica WOR_2 bacterium SM23_29]|nr:MAG: NGG1p interacting factor NIF3 [Omnitrophica WOR_2 bacterium SM23_29]
MKLSKIYELVVKEGIAADPRGRELVTKDLARAKKEYDELKEKDKEIFDKERLVNPYADSRLLNGDPALDVKTILLGIDIEIGEILLADRLRQLNKKIDLVISHHPEGYARANFYNVMNMQVDIFSKIGIPITVAEGLLKERMKEVERKVSPLNHSRAVDAAKLLNIAFMCVHTPADNHVATYLQKLIDDKKPQDVGEILEVLRDIPEYREAIKLNAGPRILIGDPKNRAGRIFVDMTGGTEGPKEIFDRLEQVGVGTVVAMHLSEEHFKNVQKEHINVVVAGHISSDSLGLNLFLDKLEKEDKLELITCSGFKRIKR